MVITALGMILRLPVQDFGVLSRATQGVRLIQLEEGDYVVAVAKLAENDEKDESEPGGEATVAAATIDEPTEAAESPEDDGEEEDV